MGGPGSGGKRIRKPRETAQPWTSDTIAKEPTKPDLAHALEAAVLAATREPEIVHGLQIQLSPDMRAVIVDIGDTQERVNLEKLEAIIATDQLANFVGGLIERAHRKWTVKATYRRLDILNAVKDELLTIVGFLYPGDEAAVPLAAVIETTAKEFGDLGETPGRVALVNRLLRKAIFERIPQSETR